MNYQNFSDGGLRMMHDAVHKAIAADCRCDQARRDPRLVGPAKRKIGAIMRRGLRTKWFVAMWRSFPLRGDQCPKTDARGRCRRGHQS